MNQSNEISIYWFTNLAEGQLNKAINKAVSFNAIKNLAFEILATETNKDKIISKLSRLFLMNTVVIRGNRKIWARFDDLGFQVTFDKNGLPVNQTRHYPDGICFDSRNNSVWVASPARKEVLCVDDHGVIAKIIKTISHPFDCIIGGHSNNILFIASSGVDRKTKTGKIECISLL